jgi:Predicted metal-binding integral membrane protein (DUF2182)
VRPAIVVATLSVAGWLGWIVLPALTVLPPTCGELSVLVAAQVGVGMFDVHLATSLLVWSLLMVTAMTAPGLRRPLAHVMGHSLPRSRCSNALIFWIGYAVPGVSITTALVLLAGATRLHFGEIDLWPAALAIWCLWVCSPWGQEAHRRVHLLPALRSFGWQRWWDSWRTGVSHGSWCSLECWPLMLWPLFSAGGTIWWMLAATVVGTLMRQLPPKARRWRLGEPARLWLALNVCAHWAFRRL